jgi:hypothetical protein
MDLPKARFATGRFDMYPLYRSVTMVQGTFLVLPGLFEMTAARLPWRVRTVSYLLRRAHAWHILDVGSTGNWKGATDRHFTGQSSVANGAGDLSFYL